MSEKGKQLRQRRNLLYQQLEIYRGDPESFLKALGEKGIEDWLNRVLDEINDIARLLRELGEEPDKN